jgi:hypothetical protein
MNKRFVTIIASIIPLLYSYGKVIDYEALKGSPNETAIKEIALAANDVIRTLYFQVPYEMRPQGPRENGLNLVDGYVPYHQLQTTVTETVAGYAHLYLYGTEKRRQLSNLISHPVFNQSI